MLDGREGVLTGDIGCYGMGIGSTGFFQVRTMHAMGSGAGLASGMGKLNQFGFNQPVLDRLWRFYVLPCRDSGTDQRRS